MAQLEDGAGKSKKWAKKQTSAHYENPYTARLSGTFATLVSTFLEKKILVKSLYPLCRKAFRQSAKKGQSEVSIENPLPNGFLPCFIDFCVSGSPTSEISFQVFVSEKTIWPKTHS